MHIGSCLEGFEDLKSGDYLLCVRSSKYLSYYSKGCLYKVVENKYNRGLFSDSKFLTLSDLGAKFVIPSKAMNLLYGIKE